MKLSETVQEVIALANAIRSYWDAELPKRHPDYPWVHPGEDDGPPPPEEQKLKDLLASLPEEELYKLALIVQIGQGFGTSDLAGRFAALKEQFEEPADAASRMARQADLGDFLADGLDELKKNGLDVDQLTLSAVNAGG